MTEKRILARDRQAILASLRTGVTPKVGLQHIQVGRAKETAALHDDIQQITQGGATFRVIVGEYGSGKTFFLHVVRAMALEMDLVTVHADLADNKRLYSARGEARNLYAELMRNLAIKSEPHGNALTYIIDYFINEAVQEAEQRDIETSQIIRERLSPLKRLVGGYDFAKVIEIYWQGYCDDNEQNMANAIRWLRAEYSTKVEVRRDLKGVGSLINDKFFYDALKLMSLFVRQAGYKGLLVNLDEMAKLYEIPLKSTRQANYSQLLTILNDCLQGTAEYIGFVLGNTEQSFADTRKGLCSYPALQSRLAANSIAEACKVTDYCSPVLHLDNLSPEELYILLKNIRHVVAAGNQQKYLVTDKDLQRFLAHCHKTMGEAYFKTPRDTVKKFVQMLSVLQQHPVSWQQLIDKTTPCAAFLNS